MDRLNGENIMSRVSKIQQGKDRRRVFPGKSALRITTVLTGLALVGCASFQKDHFTVGSTPSDYRTAHPIVVSQSEESKDIVVTSNMRKMSSRHRGVVVDIVGKYKRSGARSLHVLVPAGSHNEAAARRVAADAVAKMKELGVSPSQIRVERYSASNHGDAATIRFVYGVVGARVASECGQWSDDLADTEKNVNYKNFGCATQNNLAEMVANPEDLLGPRGESEIDASRRDNVITDWRENGS